MLTVWYKRDITGLQLWLRWITDSVTQIYLLHVSCTHGKNGVC